MPRKRKSKPRPGSNAGDSLAEGFSITSMEQLKAIAHPLRQQLFEAFAVEPATTKQVADRLGLKPTRLYHHVAKLESAGLIELTAKRQVRGTTEKYFKAVATLLKIDHEAFDSEHAQLAGSLADSGVIDGLLTNVRAEVRDALADGCVDEVIFLQAGFKTDPKTAAELRDKITALLEEAEEIAAKRKATEVQDYRMLLGWYPRRR